MIIEYKCTSRATPEPVTMRGEFRSWLHWDSFVHVEQMHGRRMYDPIVIETKESKDATDVKS
jgi:hypothetical protein